MGLKRLVICIALKDTSCATRPDIFAIGFQEIVPLTAQQIVQTDPEKMWDYPSTLLFFLSYRRHFGRRIWETRILETLDRRPNKKFDYVLLRSEQVSIIVV